jgi:ankyrin repeat protein
LIWQRVCAACGNAFDVRETCDDSPDDRELIFTWANHWTPLMAAARLDDVAIAKKLLDAGAKVDAGRLDTTPLMCACSFGHLEMAKFLIERGANVNAVCKETNSRVKSKLTAMDVAGEEENLELLELLWSAGATMEKKDAVRLAMAARNGDVKTIASLIRAGVDVNAPSPFDGETPTYAAAVNGRAEALKMLLDAGATIAPPKRGLWPLLMAASAICEGLPRKTKTAADVPRYVETFKLLIGAGASVKVAMFGHTPLKFARDAQCGPLIELFENAEANEKPAVKGKLKKK